MAQILVRGLDEDIVKRLRNKAKKHNRSLEAEVRRVLGAAALSLEVDHAAAIRSLAKLRKQLKGRKFPDSVALIREEREL